MKNNPLLEQSLNFASQIINLQKYLIKEKKETIISKENREKCITKLLALLFYLKIGLN